MKILLLLIPLLFIICSSPAYGALVDTKVHLVGLPNDTTSALYNFEFSPDGKTVYFNYGLFNTTATEIMIKYTMEIPFDIVNRVEKSRLLYSSFPFADGSNYNNYTFKITDNGEFLYLFGVGNKVYKFKFENAFGLLNLSFVESIEYSSIRHNTIEHIDFSPNGLLMYVADYDKSYITLHQLTSPFDVSFENIITLIDTGITNNSIQISHDGNQIFTSNANAIGFNPLVIQKYELTVPYTLFPVPIGGISIVPNILPNPVQVPTFISDF